jgi:assimilatory nitrate reductase catalytic subunit
MAIGLDSASDARHVADTHCPYCALQCGMSVAWNGSAFETVARDFPTNRGALCRKGWTAAELLTAPDRLTTPLMRGGKGEPLQPVSWDHAIAAIASAWQRVQSAHGRDAIGVFGGGGLTNETAYMLGKFARVVLRTASIDYNGRFCMASAAVANERALGLDRGLPFPIAHLPNTEVIALLGANPAETMPPLMQYFDEQRARGGQLIVVDPRRTLTAEYASLHLQLTPGSDAALANGLLHVAIRDGLLDHEFIAERTTGFDAVRHTVRAYWPDRVERITGVPARLIIEAAHMLGEAATALVMTARGAEQQTQGVNNVLAFINLSLALGKVGKRYCGFGCLTGQANGQGGREHGQKSDQLPGYRKLDDPEHRRHIAALWNIAEHELPKSGPHATEMFSQLGEAGGVRALLVMGSNIVVSAPNAVPLARRLGQLDLLVVADPFLSETAELADIVLPVCQWAEYTGTITNLEGRVLYRGCAKQPPAGVQTDLQILKQLAAALGRADAICDVPESAFDELARASAGGKADYAGLSYARIRATQGTFWPCPSETHPGTPEPFLERFATPDGRARFHAVDHERPGEQPDDEYPLYLTTGRVLAQYQSGTQTRRVASLRAAEPEAFVEIHPQLAASFGITDGSYVALRTRRGRGVFRARFSSSMRLDTLFVAFHWSGLGSANALTQDAVDPLSKIPEFKIAAVAIQSMAAHEEKITANN